jgi:hypothetical protein
MGKDLKGRCSYSIEMRTYINLEDLTEGIAFLGCELSTSRIGIKSDTAMLTHEMR